MEQYEHLCASHHDLIGKEGAVESLRSLLKNKEKNQSNTNENIKWKDIIQEICEKVQIIQEKLLKNQCVIIQNGGPDFMYVYLNPIFLQIVTKLLTVLGALIQFYHV